MKIDTERITAPSMEKHTRRHNVDIRVARLAGLVGGILWFVIGLVLVGAFLEIMARALALDYRTVAVTQWTTIMLYIMLGGVLAAVYAAKVFSKIALALSPDQQQFHPNILLMVSVIVPVYNGEHTIGRILRALLEQDYPRELMEIIVVDDGSTDNTWFIVKEYAEKYPFIKALRHNVNLGKAEALSTGIRSARGDIIITLDADTIPDKTAIRRLVARLAHDESLGAVCGRIVPTGIGGFLYWMQRIEYFLGFELGRFVNEKLARANLILSGAFTAFRSTVLKPLAVLGIPSDTVAEDFELTLLTWKRGFRAGYEHYALAYTAIPVNLRSLYQQRLRWYGGGLQVLLKHSNLLRLGKARLLSQLYGRLLAIHLLGIEYFLPLLHIVGYIALAVAAVTYGLFGIEIFALPLKGIAAAYLAATASTTILCTANIVVALVTEYGVRHIARLIFYALLYVLFYIPFLAVVKTDSMIRVLFGIRPKW